MLDSSIWVWLAWKLPRKLVKWCAVRVMTDRFEGNLGKRSCLEALEQWTTPAEARREARKGRGMVRT